MAKSHFSFTNISVLVRQLFGAPLLNINTQRSKLLPSSEDITSASSFQLIEEGKRELECRALASKWFSPEVMLAPNCKSAGKLGEHLNIH